MELCSIDLTTDSIVLDGNDVVLSIVLILIIFNPFFLIMVVYQSLPVFLHTSPIISDMLATPLTPLYLISNGGLGNSDKSSKNSTLGTPASSNTGGMIPNPKSPNEAFCGSILLSVINDGQIILP